MNMHELADNIAGIIHGEKHDDVRDILWLSQPARGHEPQRNATPQPTRCLAVHQ